MKLCSLRRAGALLLALAMACSLLALPAAAADPDATDPSAIPVYRVDLDHKSLQMEKGDTRPLIVSIQPPDATNQNVTWSSSDPSVATVDENGNVTAVGGGIATITANPEDTSKQPTVSSCIVTVSVPAERIILRQDELTLAVGETVSFPGVELLPVDATDSVQWDYGSRGLVTNSNGRLLGVKEGTDVITVHPRGKLIPSAQCTVHVLAAADVPVSSVELNTTSANLTADGSLNLVATVKPDNAADKEIDWRVSSGAPLSLSNNTGLRTTVTVKRGANVTEGETGYTVYATSRSNPAAYALCVVRIVKPRPQISGIQITSYNTDEFKYVDPGKSFTLTAKVSPGDLPEADQKVTWSSSDTSVATVDQTGKVTGVSPGKAVIYASAASDPGIRASREIEVSGILLSYLKRSSTGGKGEVKPLTESSVVDIYQYYDISATATVYGAAKGKSITWESSNNTVASVLNGRVAGNYPGDNTVISAAVAGTGYRASFKVRVLEDVAQAITVNMGSSPSYSFSGLIGTLNSRSQSKAGAILESVYNLKVSTENGTLYYKYVSATSPGHGVGGTEYYYYQPTQGQLALRDVTFVPSPGFDGTAIISYNAKAINGTTFTGTIRIDADATGDVTYSTEAGQNVTFSAEHFSAVCKGRTGQAIRYVTFEQPSPSRGTLYQDYAPPGLYSPKVTSGTRYYVSGRPSIGQVTFVPAEGFTGDVTFPYHCVDSTGASFNGTVTVRVAASGSTVSNGTVEYYTAVNQRRTLNGSDFNDASRRLTDTTLNFIRFDSLPSSSAGRLYLNYASASNTGTQVTTGRNYYRGSTPRISSITFVPASNFSGTVTIPYTGTNVSGTSFSGSLVIHVGVGSTGTTVRYAVPRSQSVWFNASDFNSACRSATGDTLRYLRFTSLPSSTYGTLYYRYNNGSGTAVGTGTNYYYSYSGGNRLIDDLSFLAKGVSGTASFSFTGYSVQGVSFSGRVEIDVAGGTVSSPGYATGLYYTGCAAPISFHSIDFQNTCRAALGTTLASVQFNSLPGTGRLYQNYGGPGRPGTGVTAAARYGTQELDQIVYLPRAEYQGSITIPYTAYDVQGGTHSGTVEIQLSNSYVSTTFNDLGGVAWAMPSIEFLRSSGITSGYRDNTYRPRQAISRGEFTLMICRAFQFSTTGSSGFPDVPAGSTYAGAVAAARDLGIVQGNNGRFQPDRPITRQSAMTMIYRAMEAAGRTLPAASSTILSSYRDGGQVSAFARPAVSAMIQSGAVRGTSDMRLNPMEPISRAEMAVILHRVLTL